MFYSFYLMVISLFMTQTLNAAGVHMNDSKTEEAIFAMGCFWCGESEFRDENSGKPMDGILSLRVGYAGGTKEKPIYHDHDGYKEAVKIVFDPTKISYEKLLNIFWHNHDPFDAKGQFCDKGFPYTSVIFYTNDTQKKAAEETKEKVHNLLNKDIATEIIKHTTFYDAEEYHQDYKHKNPVRYAFYRWKCGRNARLNEIGLEKVWKDEGNQHNEAAPSA